MESLRSIEVPAPAPQRHRRSPRSTDLVDSRRHLSESWRRPLLAAEVLALTLPTISIEASKWDQALNAFLVEKGNRSGSKRTVESYSRMLWRFFRTHDAGPGRAG